MRRRRRKRDDAPADLKRWDKVVTVVVAALCAVLLAALAVRSYQAVKDGGPHRAPYVGRIVDKSTTITESYTGSGAVFRLHLRARSGPVFDIGVTPGLYERARVGMWVRSGPDGPELYADEPPPANAATKTEGAEPPSVSAPQR